MTRKEEFFKRFYKNLNKEEIIRLSIEDKLRADRNAQLLNKTIEKDRNIVEEKDKEIERLNNIIKEVRKYIKYNMEKYIDYQLTIDPEEILYLLDKENKDGER